MKKLTLFLAAMVVLSACGSRRGLPCPCMHCKAGHTNSNLATKQIK